MRRLILDVRQHDGGRLTGTLRREDTRTWRAFDGVIELVGAIEMYLAEDGSEQDTSGGEPPDAGAAH